MQKILIVEDERDIANLIGFNIERAGFGVLMAHDGIAGAEIAKHERPDLIVLDLMLPGKDGYAVFKDLRRDARTRSIPVIMLTAKAQTQDKIEGLEAGADDYITKPFSPKELLLRIRAVLKRADAPPGSAEFVCGPLRFDKNNVSFYLDGEAVELTATEFKLLLFLAERAGRVQDRNDLLRTVWGYSDEVHSRTLDTHMKRLRQKLGERAAMIETVRGIGYQVFLPEK
jgi:two-component system phosphate regulon response regulator PhoB